MKFGRNCEIWSTPISFARFGFGLEGSEFRTVSERVNNQGRPRAKGAAKKGKTRSINKWGYWSVGCAFENCKILKSYFEIGI